jgi:carboxyl-terminal processing protease
MRGLILDLRYNPGGLLDSAIRISDMFLDHGVIVSTKGRGGAHERITKATAEGTLPQFPIVVLVNEGSASASEIVSGALKDNDRAIIVGTRTVGKGSVQELMKLDGEAGAVKLTTIYYYLPSGRNINRHDDKDVWGVDPTDGYYVPMSVDERKEMIKVRREGDIIKGAGGDDEGDAKVTPEWLADSLKDIQLGAALKTMLAKLTDGQFIPVGKPNATLLAFITERDTLTRRREMYEERITAIDKEVKRLNGLIAAPEEETKTGDEVAAEGADQSPPDAPLVDQPMVEEEAVP